jgi:hypothetical protein
MKPFQQRVDMNELGSKTVKQVGNMHSERTKTLLSYVRTTSLWFHVVYTTADTYVSTFQ